MARGAVMLLTVAALISSAGPALVLDSAAATSQAPPSAFGNEAVTWIVASPAYAQTGLIVAQGFKLGCQPNENCSHLWITQDGGATWRQAPAKGWSDGRIAIAVDSSGHETLLSGSTNALQRSTDYGATFSNVGVGGDPGISPNYPKDRTVGVAGQGSADHILKGDASQNVNGSGGKLIDIAFMLGPDYPSGGSSSPALLVGADPNSRLPVIQHCSADLSCTGSTTLPGIANVYAAPATRLYPAADYGQRGAVFANSGQGLYKSTDGGITFLPIQVLATAGATTTATPEMALAPGYREAGTVRTVYVAVLQLFQTQNPADPKGSAEKSRTSGGVYASSDGGSTWSALNTDSFSGGALSMTVASDGRIFAAYYDGQGHGGLLCSTDGKAWKATCPASAKTAGTAGSVAPPATPDTNATSSPCPGDACPSPGADGSTIGTNPARSGPPGGFLNSPAAIAGAAVLVALAAAGLGFLFWRRRRGHANAVAEGDSDT